MPSRAPALQEDSETLSIEIAAILTHTRDSSGGSLLGFLASPDAFAGSLPWVRAIVRATLEPHNVAGADLLDQSAAIGIAAQAVRLDATALMSVCTRVVDFAQLYLLRARPELEEDEEWQVHWSTLNRVICRAAFFGHRRGAFADDSDWRAALHDASAGLTIGLHVAGERAARRSAERRAVVTGNERAIVVDAIRTASARIDRGEDAVIATDKSGTILYWNEAAATLYGWRSAEVLGRNVLDVMPATHAMNEAERIMHQLLTGRAWSGHFIVRDKTGAQKRVQVTDIPVKHEGGVVGIVGLSAPASAT